MAGKAWTFRVGSVLIGILASVILGAVVLGVAYLVSPLVLIGPTRSMAARMQGTNSLRQLVGPVAQSGKLPMKDGAFDPYDLVRQGHISRGTFYVLRSERSGTGPTDEEIENGDYTNFPWERYRGDGKLDGPPFPLLWEKKPDDKGMVLVGLSDGTVAYRDHASSKPR